MTVWIALLPLGIRESNSGAYIAILRDELIQSRKHLEVPNDLGYHSLNLQQGELLTNAVSGSSAEGYILKRSWFLQLKALRSELVGIFEHLFVITQHHETQVQCGALGYEIPIYKQVWYCYVKLFKML